MYFSIYFPKIKIYIFTKLYGNMLSNDEVDIIIREKIAFKNPVIIGGFIGQTPLGVTTSSYIVESMGMHEVAMVKSHHIPPVTVFVGGKMRNPFRIYSNSDGSVMVIQAEVPVDDEGLYTISEALFKWIKQFKPKEWHHASVYSSARSDGMPTNYYSIEEVKAVLNGKDPHYVTDYNPEELKEKHEELIHTIEAYKKEHKTNVNPEIVEVYEGPFEYKESIKSGGYFYTKYVKEEGKVVKKSNGWWYLPDGRRKKEIFKGR